MTRQERRKRRRQRRRMQAALLASLLFTLVLIVTLRIRETAPEPVAEANEKNPDGVCVLQILRKHGRK